MSRGHADERAPRSRSNRVARGPWCRYGGYASRRFISQAPMSSGTIHSMVIVT
jgi:hypothetical protein